VGVLAPNLRTNPRYAPQGLALLSEGVSPNEAIRQLLQQDGNFEGQGIEARLVGILAIDGQSAAY